MLRHVLEHLGQDPKVFIRVMQELYRVCRDRAVVQIAVPHHRHDHFFNDPTHVRAITAEGLGLFCKRLNRESQARGLANSPLGLFHDVDFEVVSLGVTASALCKQLRPDIANDPRVLLRESQLYNNLIEQLEFKLRAVK
jgi:hypothetical protein